MGGTMMMGLRFIWTSKSFLDGRGMVGGFC